MRKRTIYKSAVTLLLCCVLLLAAAPVSAAPSANVTAKSNTGFSDVPRDAWYEEAILRMQNYTPGIISGYPDGTFRPGSQVTRGEFLRWTMAAMEEGAFTADHSRDGIHWAGRYYTIALEHNVLIADVYSSTAPMFPCTAAALDTAITRYEMAVILTNACTNMQMEQTVVVSKASSNIPDYSNIGSQYVTAVEQAYGKGLLSGYPEDGGAFHGERTLSRAEAVSSIYRLQNWKGSRTMPSWATQPTVSIGNYNSRPSGFVSFAEWLRNGHVDSYGNIDAEAKARLFGAGTAAAARGYFVSAAEAEPYMTSVSIPMWALDSNGQKYSTTGYLTVNKAVAEEVRLIFTQIYNDPERFPIYGYSVGGARFSDRLRHSWGCAIDINAYYNCECNFSSGYQRVTCGYGWRPAGVSGWAGRDISAYAGSMSAADSVYSITPNGSVVRAFADYGWGWLGNGFSNATRFDFMHFSVLPSGG